MTPRGERESVTGRGILVDYGVNIPAKARARESWRPGERRQHCFGGYKDTLTQGNQFSNGYAVPRDDKRLSLVEIAHDAPAFVAELSLCDPSTHGRTL